MTPAGERNADDDSVDGLVAMPADGCAGPVFADQCVDEGVWGQVEPCRHLVAQIGEERRKRTAGEGIGAAVLVARRQVLAVEMRNAPLGEVFAEARFAKRQWRNVGEQGILFIAREEVGLVAKPLRQLLRAAEETGLL
ncbi:MAG: hypothetical protein ABI881_15325 [Betaproteobacteria bacterium]